MLLRLILVLSLTVSLTACVVRESTYKEALVQIQNLKSERDGLLDKVKEIETNLDKKSKEAQTLSDNMKLLDRDKKEIEAKLKDLEQETEQKAQEIVKLKKDVEDIRVAKDKEIEEIKYKIKEVQTRAEALLEKIKEIQK